MGLEFTETGFDFPALGVGFGEVFSWRGSRVQGAGDGPEFRHFFAGGDSLFDHAHRDRVAVVPSGLGAFEDCREVGTVG